MASAITLAGIDQAISNLEYINENTLKYKFVRQIRQHYIDDNAINSLKEIDHTVLIRLLWDGDDDPEALKNKRRNLNSLRSSVNADLKKLYEKGINPEGIKIGPSNIFVMSEDAKDNILNTFGYDLQPDGTLKLEQIMDILKLANETVSDSMTDESTTGKADLVKKNRFKELIGRLSEKLGLGAPEFPKSGDVFTGQQTELRGLSDNIDIVDEADALLEMEDVEEEEILEEVDDVEATDIEDSDPEMLVGEEIDEDFEDVSDDLESELEYADVTELDGVGDLVADVIEEVDAEIVSKEEETGEVFEGASDDGDGELEYIDVDEDDDSDHGSAREDAGESGTGGNDTEIEQLGLPVDSLGQAHEFPKNTKLQQNKLLAEVFDGYLGSMDRYYNHYIFIEGGGYLIGSRYPKKDERAEQTVNLEPFYFGRFPVTNGLFEIFVEKTGYKTTAEKVGYGTVYYGRFKKRKDGRTGLITSKWNSSLYCKVVKGACWYRPSGPESTLYNKRNHPVVQISFEDAAAFAAWTGKRLPTENEWEAASRTDKGSILPWGRDWKNDAANIEDSGIADTTPVDRFAEFENDFGIVDVLGNVMEWTDDGFKMPAHEDHESPYRIAKGGSWVSGNDIRLDSRFRLNPESHSNILGFRCVAY